MGTTTKTTTKTVKSENVTKAVSKTTKSKSNKKPLTAAQRLELKEHRAIRDEKTLKLYAKGETFASICEKVNEFIKAKGLKCTPHHTPNRVKQIAEKATAEIIVKHEMMMHARKQDASMKKQKAAQSVIKKEQNLYKRCQQEIEKATITLKKIQAKA